MKRNISVYVKILLAILLVGKAPSFRYSYGAARKAKINTKILFAYLAYFAVDVLSPLPVFAMLPPGKRVTGVES